MQNIRSKLVLASAIGAAALGGSRSSAKLHSRNTTIRKSHPAEASSMPEAIARSEPVGVGV